MAKCRVCGKRVGWLRSICPECRAERFFGKMPGGADQGPTGLSRTFVRKSSSTRITIIVNGKPVEVSAEGEATPELLQRLSAKVGLPEDQLGDLLKHALEQSTSAGVNLPAGMDHDVGLADAPGTGAAHGPLHKVRCPQCERTVPDRNGWCMYCGAELTPRETTPAKESGTEMNEVDRAFLEGDVRPPERVKEEERVRETYKDRLSDL